MMKVLSSVLDWLIGRQERCFTTNSNKSRNSVNIVMAAASGSGTEPQNLSQYIDTTNLSCLNSKHPVEASTLNMISDADEQLLLHVPFTQIVKVHGIKVTGNVRTLSVWVNRLNNMGFEDAESESPTQTWVLQGGKPAGEHLLTNFVRFQNVSSLTFFIKDNRDDSDCTRVDRLLIEGFPGASMQMKDFKRVAGDKNEGHGMAL